MTKYADTLHPIAFKFATIRTDLESAIRMAQEAGYPNAPALLRHSIKLLNEIETECGSLYTERICDSEQAEP